MEDVPLRYRQTTLPNATLPKGVRLPDSLEALIEIVKSAQSDKRPIHCFSAGRNWGYGDAQATAAGVELVDLQKMNKIVEVNVDLGYAVVEPGVTQGQLFRYLEENDLPLWMDANGAGPDTSLVGNALERGFGHTPLGDRALENRVTEFLLMNGELISHQFENDNPSRYTYGSGVGPDFFGLLQQSNYAIVTKMMVRLMPRPESFRAFYVGAQDDQIGHLVDSVRGLKQSGVLKSCVHIGNAVRTLSNQVDYPWETQQAGRKALEASFWSGHLEKVQLNPWNGSGGLYGPQEVVESQVSHLQKKFSEFSFMSLSLEEAEKMGLQDAVGLLYGRPTNSYLYSAGWRSKSFDRKQSDPLANNSGLIWFAPRFPATKEHLSRVRSLMSDIYAKYEFDLPITLTFVNSSTLIATTNISFDRTDPEEGLQAMQCFEELTEVCTRAGYPPYRMPLGKQHTLSVKKEFARLAHQIGRVFDPENLLNPGRYEFV